MPGPHAFRSSSASAIATIGRPSKASGSSSCSCKGAATAAAVPITNLIKMLTIRRATIAVPAGLHEVILDSFLKKMERRDAKYETRLVSFVVAVAIILLFTAPHMVWKYMGQKRATNLVKQWEAEDARGRPPGSFCPVWSVRLAGYLSSSTVRQSAKANLLPCRAP